MEANKKSLRLMRIYCSVFFLLFAWIYVFYYQANMLYVLQHLLSHGATTYQRTIGGTLIIIVLCLINMAARAAVRLRLYTYALTYFPSMFVMGLLADVAPVVQTGHYPLHWLFVGLPLVALFGGAVWVCRQLEEIQQPPTNTGTFSRLTWVNLLIMSVLALMTLGMGTNNTLLHHRADMERLMDQQRFEQALNVGDDDMKTDSSLVMLRVMALSMTHQVGERLFTYPLVGGSDALLPSGRFIHQRQKGSTRLLIWREDRFYRNYGAVLTDGLTPRQYFEKLCQTRYATPAAHEALLAACLLDRDLDAFARQLTHYYKVNDSLPTHYREALILYKHTRRNPLIRYDNAVMDQDYDDFTTLSRKYSNPTERRSMVRDTYGKTYWWYYHFK